MITYLQHLACWDWLALTTVCLVIEVFGTGGYLLWVGLSAVTLGALTFLIPDLPWALQVLLFLIAAMLSTLLWWRHQQSARRSH
ncbi:Inner membrane protein ybbJ [Pseudomonas sp. 8Z]|uniref:NfeD family protein n=1 Tax=Pseudomonas sp. 8Z TaxID=2653166 RepID=UPI0012F2CE21|nr:NfeD family protein [Pseudomonas sp. 8Z]VXC06272.1 Inner membrane protein ybbJ [Pseudomonas sp. 8Z]